MHIWTSGRQAWNVFLYAYCPFKAGDPRPWKLLYVGGDELETRHVNDIDCIYIDVSKRSIVFARRRGEVIGTIPISTELAMFQKR